MGSAQLNGRLCGVVLFSLLGCAPQPAARETYQPEYAPIPAVTGTQMRELVQSSDRPVIIEFGVNIGCARCGDMHSQVAELARELEGTARVVRVDFNANRQLAAQYGADVCPSYVVFQQGRAVSTQSYPTSADRIRIDLESAALPSEGL